MERMARRLRHAVRQLAVTPGFTVAAMVTLSLAVGAATAIFSAVHAVLLRPTAIHDPGSVVVGWGRDPSRTEGVIELSYLDVADLGRASHQLVNTAAVGSHTWNAVLDGIGEPVRLSYAGVSGSFFEALGARALHGELHVGARSTEAERRCELSAGLAAERRAGKQCLRLQSQPGIWATDERNPKGPPRSSMRKRRGWLRVPRAYAAR